MRHTAAMVAADIRRAWIVAAAAVGCAVTIASGMSYAYWRGAPLGAAAHSPSLKPQPNRLPTQAAPAPHHAEATHLTPGPAEMGLASWYDVDGEGTASGEPMSGDGLTAAHPTLPIGARVLVENVENGQFVVVRITGRGPYDGGRIIDLSRAAAAEIGMIEDGVATVRVRQVQNTMPGTGPRASLDHF